MKGTKDLSKKGTKDELAPVGLSLDGYCLDFLMSLTRLIDMGPLGFFASLALSIDRGKLLCS